MIYLWWVQVKAHGSHVVETKTWNAPDVLSLCDFLPGSNRTPAGQVAQNYVPWLRMNLLRIEIESKTNRNKNILFKDFVEIMWSIFLFVRFIAHYIFSFVFIAKPSPSQHHVTKAYA